MAYRWNDFNEDQKQHNLPGKQGFPVGQHQSIQNWHSNKSRIPSSFDRLTLHQKRNGSCGSGWQNDNPVGNCIECNIKAFQSSTYHWPSCQVFGWFSLHNQVKLHHHSKYSQHVHLPVGGVLDWFATGCWRVLYKVLFSVLVRSSDHHCSLSCWYHAFIDWILFYCGFSYFRLQKNGSFGLGLLLLFLYRRAYLDLPLCWTGKHRLLLLRILRWIADRNRCLSNSEKLEYPKHSKQSGCLSLRWWKCYLKFWGFRVN